MRFRMLMLAVLSLSILLGALNDIPGFGGYLVVPSLQEGDMLDPALARNPEQRQVAALMFSRLLSFNADGRLSPGIIASWDSSFDGHIVTLTMQPPSPHEAVTPFSSGDVAISLQQAMRNAPHAPAMRILQSIVGSQRYLEGSTPWLPGIVVPDNRTLQLRLSERQPLLLHALTDINAAPARVSSQPDAIALDRGAFSRLSSREYEANLSYRPGRPFIDGIADSVTVNRKWRSPAVHLTARSDTAAQIIEYPGLRCLYLAVHPQGRLRAPGSRVAVRNAIDTDEMTRIFFSNRGQSMHSLIPDSLYPSALLGSGGWPEPGALPETLRLAFESTDSDARLMAERIKVDLLVAGVQTELIPYNGGRAPACELLIFSSLISSAAPEYSFWCALVHLQERVGSGDWATLAPRGEALGWMRQMHEKIGAEATLLPAVSLRHTASVDPRLQGLRLLPDGTFLFDETWIRQDGAEQ